MSNNKQSSVEWLMEKIATKDSDSFIAMSFYVAFKEEFEQAKAMHKEEQSRFTIDYFNWLHNNQYKYNPKVKMYQKMMINETLFFTIDELMMEFNKTLWGIDEKQ